MLLKIYPENPAERQLKLVKECLQDGGVIIYPTDTVYAIGCDLMQIKAVDRVAQIKGVKREKANFSIICKDLSHLSDFSRPISNPVYKLMRKYFPGPFTFILNANNNVPHFFQSKKKTIGIRVPDHNVPIQIVEWLGNPIVTTSLHSENIIEDYLVDPELIYDTFKKVVDIVIDSGFGGNLASTVIDCTDDVPTVVRPGKGIFED